MQFTWPPLSTGDGVISRVSSSQLTTAISPTPLTASASTSSAPDALRECILHSFPSAFRQGGVMDGSNMNQVVVDPTKRTVRVGPGAKLGDIYNKVYEKGLLFPGGACGDVHVGGLVQGGGWGLTARRMGLTCDALDSIKIVIWNASRREFQEITVGLPGDPNHRLVWGGSGGGGGNFGVATEFVFKVEPIPGQKIITQFTATWKDRGLMRNVIDGWRTNVLRSE